MQETQNRHQRLAIAISAAMFLIYLLLQPLGNGYRDLPARYYDAKVYGVTPDNENSLFQQETLGEFLVRTDAKLPVKTEFIFKRSANIRFTFATHGADAEDVAEFTIVKNDKPIETLRVSKESPSSISINAKAHDIVTIATGDNEHSRQAIARITTEQYIPFFKTKLLAAPILWLFLTFYLASRRHLSIAVNSYLIFLVFIVADKLTFGSLSSRHLYAYSSLSMGLAFAFTWIYQEFYWARRFKLATALSFIIAVIIYAIPASYLIYYLNFNETIDRTALYAVFQTNTREAFEFWNDFLATKWTGLYVLCLIAVGVLMVTHEYRKDLKIKRSLLLIAVGAFSILTASTATSLRLPHQIYSAAKEYHTELATFRKLLDRRNSGQSFFAAHKDHDDELHVVIIGESLNKRHMSLYGYHRPTTPLLSELLRKDEIIAYVNAFSSHTHTMPVLSHALTEANQFNNKKYFESASIIDALKAARFETVWITNQSLLGAWDNLVSIIANSADKLIGINTSFGRTTQTQSMDHELLPYFHQEITQPIEGNKAIIVHLMGNHGSYCNRFTEDFAEFSEPLSRGMFGRKISEGGLTQAHTINCYDNSVLYNDYVVSSIIKALQERGGVSSAVYLADHGEDVIADLGHNSAKFTFEMTNIPLIFWMSDDFKKRYPEKSKNIANGADRFFSNDLLYDTVLGLAGIDTHRHESRYDLTSNDYSVAADRTYTLHGKRLLADNKNYIWWQSRNYQILKSREQETRVIPHRINSIGKLHDVWSTGYRSFEIDILFEQGDSSFFLIGHESKTSGERFDFLLDSVQTDQIQKIWFDLKNLNEDNYQAVLTELEALDRRYGLKNRIILESGTRHEWFKIFRENGWHTSYYAPTSRIVGLLKDDDKAGMEELAQSMVLQVHKQNVAAVSFDHRAYPFIKEYLEPLLDPDIVYHSWYGPRISNGDFESALDKTPTYLDPRVKTVLVTFQSPFHL